jgi:hypothetical protein
MFKMARIMANKTIHADSGLVPITMGKGPMNISTPKFAEPLESTAATIRIIIPMNIMKNPTINNIKNFWNLLGSLFAYVESFLDIIVAFSPLFEH